MSVKLGEFPDAIAGSPAGSSRYEEFPTTPRSPPAASAARFAFAGKAGTWTSCLHRPDCSASPAARAQGSLRAPSGTVMKPTILGLSHVGLSVRDRDAARHFWVDVLGFDVVSEGPEYCFMIDSAARLAVTVTTHNDSVTGDFDEHNTGLDHLSYAVPDVETLLSWEQRLDQFAVPHSPIEETDAGHHLNLRAPDNFALELYVMSREFAMYLGIDEAAEPVAATHR